MTRSAEFSDCGKYRYQLTRIWDDSLKVAMCIGLNPSTANSETDDSTIRYVIDVLKANGYGGFRMMNLYALISSVPEALWDCPDPQGLNDEWLKTTAFICQDIIYCWGSFKGISYRASKVRAMFPDGKCFGKAKSTGQPLHPQALARRGVKAQDVNVIKYG